MPLLVFDGDCGFCTSSASIARRRINRDVDIVPWQRADLPALGLTEAQCKDAVQYRDPDGRWSSAGAAITALLRDAGPPWSWIARVTGLRGVRILVEVAYHVVSANRGRLPGGTPACQSSP